VAHHTISVTRYLNPAGETQWCTSFTRGFAFKRGVDHNPIDKVTHHSRNIIDAIQTIIQRGLLLKRHGVSPSDRVEAITVRRKVLVKRRRAGEEVWWPEIERPQRLGQAVVVRADAAFATPGRDEAREARGVQYAIPLPANERLERAIAAWLTPPVGRPSQQPVIWDQSVPSQAASWQMARRGVASVEATKKPPMGTASAFRP
jgi:Transposase DDE domain group 1